MAPCPVICAFSGPPADDLTAALELTDRLRLVRGEDHPELWISWARWHDIEPVLAAALAAGTVASAALLTAVPSPDERWILSEWPGRVAVHRSVARELDPRLWTDPSSYELLGLRTFAPGPPGQAGSAGPAWRLGPAGIAADWVRTAAEYRAAAGGGRPAIISASMQQVMSRSRDWFGDLADERTGGMIAVLAMSGVSRHDTDEPFVLRSPAALGLAYVAGPSTLAAHCHSGRLSVRAWGVGSAAQARHLFRDLGPDLAPGDGGRRAARLPDARLAALRAARARYGVLVELTAREETEVHLETGLVFEQETLTGVQCLAVAQGTVAVVPPGKLLRLLPAWCLNRPLAPPGGEPVRPTPFLLPVSASTDQGTVWRIAERCFGPLGSPA